MKKKIKNILTAIGIMTVACYAGGFVFNCLVKYNFKLNLNIYLLAHGDTFKYTGFLMAAALLIYGIYYYRHYWLKATNRIIKGRAQDSDIKANLENARFQSDKDLQKNFVQSSFETLSGKQISGVPVKAVQGQTYDIHLTKPAHALIIGTTGSGKTTTYINPIIQILAECGNKASMLIADPKGELYQLHAKSLIDRGYDVKVLDLRNPFHSIKWNPLERAYLNHQRALNIETEAIANEETGGYTFEGNYYQDIDELENAFAIKRQEINDIVYEDLHDIATVLSPILNKREPMWESGAKFFILAIALAMLEDSGDPDLGMTKERYNFYNLKAVATNTENECAELTRYFMGRPETSQARALSKQVLDSSDKTRGSYLSTLFDKLNLFADQSLCSLTSKNELDFTALASADKPTVVFLQIPDERETRHPLAAMVILQAYKELVRVANEKPDLTLPRPVYFLLDEFGQLPPIPKLEQMITVGRSRNIWLHLVVQSYAQLIKVYDEKTAEIIKSNTNIQVFIGSTDQKTIEEFSKRCGNYTVITRNVGYNTIKASDINSNASVKERPLIYPSELQKLNSPEDMGNAIVTVFGFNPIRSKYTPSFRCHSLKMEKTVQKPYAGTYFDASRIHYSIKERNNIKVPLENNGNGAGSPAPVNESELDLMIGHYKNLAAISTEGLLSEAEGIQLQSLLDRRQYMEAIKMLDDAQKTAHGFMNREKMKELKDLSEKLIGLQQAIKHGKIKDLVDNFIEGGN